MLYGGDAQWWRHYWQPIEQTESEHWTISDAMRGIEGINWIQGIDEAGMSKAPDRVHYGGNSGYQAINLVALWGARRIVLLGFDMQAGGKKLHAHADHPPHLGNPFDFGLWRERFAVAAPDLRSMGVEVINATRRTALRAFEQRPLSDVIERPPEVCHGMAGFGDNLYARPFVRELARGHEVYLRTPWPQLYADLEHVTFVRTNTTLRTQWRNETDSRFAKLYADGDAALGKLSRLRPDLGARQISYTRELATQHGSMWTGLARTFDIEPSGPMDLPPLPDSPVMSDRPICLVRPVTVREEWRNAARNPLPAHVADVAAWLRAEGMYVVSIADLADGQEVAEPPLPEADKVLHRGELEPLQLLALVRASAAVVGGVGWIVPAAIAAHVPAFFVLGGQGGHNAPERITDPSMAVDLIGWGIPDAFCRCSSMRHLCAKGNSRLRAQFDEWRLRVAGFRPAALAA